MLFIYVTSQKEYIPIDFFHLKYHVMDDFFHQNLRRFIGLYSKSPSHIQVYSKRKALLLIENLKLADIWGITVLLGNVFPLLLLKGPKCKKMILLTKEEDNVISTFAVITILLITFLMHSLLLCQEKKTFFVFDLEEWERNKYHLEHSLVLNVVSTFQQE